MAKKKSEIEIIEEEGEENTQADEKVKNEVNPTIKKTILTLFLFLLPLVVMAFTQEMITKILLFCYLAVLLGNFISDKFSVENN